MRHVSTIRLVRHAQAAAGFTEHHDPGLDEHGRAQAEAFADAVSHQPPVAVVTSPLARARETAAPLAARWGVEPRVEPAVSEIPSFGRSLAERGPWLRRIMAGTWADAGPEVEQWRDEYVEALRAVTEDCLVFTHFVGINAALAVCTGHQEMTVAHLDHVSVTTLRAEDAQLRLVAVAAHHDDGSGGGSIVL